MAAFQKFKRQGKVHRSSRNRYISRTDLGHLLVIDKEALFGANGQGLPFVQRAAGAAAASRNAALYTSLARGVGVGAVGKVVPDLFRHCGRAGRVTEDLGEGGDSFAEL